MRSIDKGPQQGARYRVRASRSGPARQVTHLAQIEAFRRAVASSGIPFLSDGKRKRPRLAFGPAISVGYESRAEYFDLETQAPVPPLDIASALGKTLDEGFAVQEVRRIPAFFPSLDATINVVRYEIRGSFPVDAGERLARLLARPDIVIEKAKDGGARIERVDAKPLLIEMRMTATDQLELALRFGPRRTLKPEALIRELLGLPHPVPAAGAPPQPLEGFAILRKELLSETSKGQLLTP
ncbi:MAG TPA: TIGR03936 family radical SAM-associated protein [Elusimicrobiota bacterium]|nr:TIGR03936 family radical SAM-associated protein [Elusimicrobiota bacterium]